MDCLRIYEKEDYLALYYSCLYEAGNELYDMIEKKIGLDEWEGHRESEIIDTVKAYLLKSTKIVWQSSMSRFFYQDDFEGGQQELQNEQVALNFLNRLREEGKIKEFYENGVRTIESKKKMVYDSIDSFDRVVDEKKLRKDYIFGGGSSREFDDNLHLDAIFKAQSDNDRNKKIEMRYEFIKKKYGEDYAIQDKKSIEILRDSFNFLNDDMIFYLLVAEGDDEYAKSKIGNKDFYKIKNMNSQEITCKDGIRGFGGLEPLTMDILVEETNIVNVALLLVGGFAGRGVGSLTGTSQALSKFSALYPRTAMILREWCAIGGGMLGGEIINPYLPDELQGVNVDFALMGGISGFLSKISSGVVMSGVLIEDTITGERKLIIETGESSFGAKGSISGDKVVLERYSAKQMDAFAKQMVERAVKAEEALKEVLGCGAKKESFDLVKLAEELKKKGSLSISDEQLEFILKGDFFEGDYLSPKELIDIFGENAEFVNSVQKRIAAANIVLKNKKLLPPGSSLSPEQKRLITLIESLKDSKLKKKLFIESGLFDFGEGCSESIFKELTEYIVLEIPELRVSLNSLKSSQTKFDPSKFPKYDNNLARSDVDIFMEIEARTGNPIDLNYYKARRYFVEKGYILNGGKPISDMETLVKELSKLENRNLHFKWVIDKEGELYIGIETTGNMPELTHSILAYGDEILGGGEINFFGSLDDLSVIANPKTGHYVPELGSEISPLEFSKDALEVLESYFKSKLLNLFLLIVSGS